MNSEETALLIKQIMGQAIAEQARRHTYCLIYEETGETKVGTSVAVKLGNRFFLATAGHVIEDAQSIKALMHDQIAPGFSDFVAKHYDSQLDVGLLEISLCDSQRFDFLPQDRLYEEIEEAKEIPAIVIGFASQFCNAAGQIGLTQESSLRVVRCDTLTFNTFVLPVSKWPSDGLPDEYGMNRQLVDGRDMLIDYTPEPEIIPFTPRTAGTDIPSIECLSLDPHGMSGGGIWLKQISESNGRVNLPDIRLIGLQLGWHRSKNLLRGIRIGAWLDLVRERYSEFKTLEE